MCCDAVFCFPVVPQTIPLGMAISFPGKRVPLLTCTKYIMMNQSPKLCLGVTFFVVVVCLLFIDLGKVYILPNETSFLLFLLKETREKFSVLPSLIMGKIKS